MFQFQHIGIFGSFIVEFKCLDYLQTTKIFFINRLQSISVFGTEVAILHFSFQGRKFRILHACFTNKQWDVLKLLLPSSWNDTWAFPTNYWITLPICQNVLQHQAMKTIQTFARSPLSFFNRLSPVLSQQPGTLACLHQLEAAQQVNTGCWHQFMKY